MSYTTWGPGDEPKPLRYHVDRLIDAPLAAQGRYVGTVGTFSDWRDGNRPIGLEFGEGHRVWFREDEVALLQPGKAYPF